MHVVDLVMPVDGEILRTMIIVSGLIFMKRGHRFHHRVGRVAHEVDAEIVKVHEGLDEKAGSHY